MVFGALRASEAPRGAGAGERPGLGALQRGPFGRLLQTRRLAAPRGGGPALLRAAGAHGLHRLPPEGGAPGVEVKIKLNLNI